MRDWNRCSSRSTLTGSAATYDGLWQRRAALAAIPSLVVWGLKDSAFRPNQLTKWREALPHARVVELPAAGHWPHEEEPDAVEDAAPWIPELHASRKAPPPTTAAPTPAARNRLRRETRPAGGCCSVLSGWAVWSVMVGISP